MHEISLSPNAKRLLLEIRVIGLTTPDGYVPTPSIQLGLSDKEFAFCITELLENKLIKKQPPNEQINEYIRSRGTPIITGIRYALDGLGYSFLERLALQGVLDAANAQAAALKAKTDLRRTRRNEICMWCGLAIALAGLILSICNSVSINRDDSSATSTPPPAVSAPSIP